MGAGIGKTSHYTQPTQKEIDEKAQEQYNSIYRIMGNRHRDFVVHSFYFWCTNGMESGTVYDSMTGNVTVWTADVKNDILDVWTDGHFVDYGPYYFDPYMKWLDAKIDQELLDGVTA